MNKLILIICAFVCFAISCSAYQLPIIFNIGGFDEANPIINTDIQAVGPFIRPRNVSLTFTWQPENFEIYGVRIRGSEPRYDRIAVEVDKLTSDEYSITVRATNAYFIMFWAEAVGYELVPLKNDN